MNAVEAVPLVFSFLLVLYLTVANFTTTVNGYLAVIDARVSMVRDALGAAKPAYYQPRTAKNAIGPYFYKCEEGVKAYLANGYVALTISATKVGLSQAYSDYVLLIPSPNYFTRADSATSPPRELECWSETQQTQEEGGARAFLVYPNGVVKVVR